MSDSESLAVIVLSRRVEGNRPASYDSLQSALLPYFDSLQVFWWGVWICVLAAVAVHFLILPNLRARRGVHTGTTGTGPEALGA